MRAVTVFLGRGPGLFSERQLYSLPRAGKHPITARATLGTLAVIGAVALMLCGEDFLDRRQ
jgi:hypothetical protein